MLSALTLLLIPEYPGIGCPRLSQTLGSLEAGPAG